MKKVKINDPSNIQRANLSKKLDSEGVSTSLKYPSSNENKVNTYRITGNPSDAKIGLNSQMSKIPNPRPNFNPSSTNISYTNPSNKDIVTLSNTGYAPRRLDGIERRAATYRRVGRSHDIARNFVGAGKDTYRVERISVQRQNSSKNGGLVNQFKGKSNTAITGY